MKFYIASRVKDKEIVKEIHKKLLDKGHTFTSDWVEEKNIIPYKNHIKEAEILATKCIDAINNSDVFILISDETGAGMYTELGIALQLTQSNGKLRIYVIGEYNNRSVFFFHNLIKRRNNLDEVFTDLEDN